MKSEKNFIFLELCVFLRKNNDNDVRSTKTNSIPKLRYLLFKEIFYLTSVFVSKKKANLGRI